jgi:ATP-dependent RNA/DNA helicase IGHMBP2
MHHPNADDFARHHRALLDLERQAEVDRVRVDREQRSKEELERRGVLLRRLCVADLEVSAGGRATVVLASSRGEDLPGTRFQSGDVVVLVDARATTSPGEDEPTGVVVKVRRDNVAVALDDEDADLPSLIDLHRVAPDVTYRRMAAALSQLGRGGTSAATKLVQALFERDAAIRAGDSRPALTALSGESLDPAQERAVAMALASKPLALIHGPPGTGKTTAVVAFVRRAVAAGERVLACAPSNVAVDNLAERLVAAGLRVLRLGHPARVLASIRDCTLDARIEAGIDEKIRREMRRETQLIQRRIESATDRRERQQLRAELRALRAERRRLEDGIVRGELDLADVVLATLSGAADRVLEDRVFDRVVIDEAAQSIEAANWIALLRGRAGVLAGDHRQLPPTILSATAARDGLARTLFERAAEADPGELRTVMLTRQYRMHAAIMAWASAAMYSGRLEAADAVRGHLLRDLPGVVDSRDTSLPMLWIDTAGCGLEETVSADDESRSNDGEVRLVDTHVRALLQAGVGGADIGVITPYNAQVQRLRLAFADRPEIEVDTVDGFQGREKEAIVLSMVRSNDRGEVGFLADARRINVAVTRARRHVALVGDSATLANDSFLAALIDHVATSGEHRSAWEMLAAES